MNEWDDLEDQIRKYSRQIKSILRESDLKSKKLKQIQKDLFSFARGFYSIEIYKIKPTYVISQAEILSFFGKDYNYEPGLTMTENLIGEFPKQDFNGN